MQPPDEPSRDIAKANAIKIIQVLIFWSRAEPLTVLHEFDSLFPIPAFLVCRIAVTVDIC